MRALLTLIAACGIVTSVLADQLTYDVQIPVGVPQGEGFGNAIAIDDTTALVGARSASRGGAAYVLERSGANWNHVQDLPPYGGMHGGAGYGAAVAILGDRALVGAPNTTENGFFNRGRVVHYRKVNGVWSTNGSIIPFDLATESKFGTSVDLTTIDGTTYAAIGAPGNVSLGGSGKVYIYRESGNSWSLVTTVAAGAIGDGFGTSVALSGQGLLVGAPYYAVSSSPTNAGRVYFYRNTDGTGNSWTFEDAEVDPFAESGAAFGFSVDISGSWAVVGSPHWGSTDSGALLFYQRVGSAWILRDCLAGQSSSQTGFSVSFGAPFSGAPRCVVGQPGLGRAQYYERQSNGSWVATYTFQPSGGQADGVGRAVAYAEINSALPGALIGAPQSDSGAENAGRVTAYELMLFGPLLGWSQANSLTGRWHDRADRLGSAVDGEGDLWAYGAPGDNDEGGLSGAVYVYRRDQLPDPTMTLEAKLTVPQPIGAGFLSLGSSVSVSNGRIAVGAEWETIDESANGAVYLFDDTSGSWQQTARIAAPLAVQGAFFGSSLVLHEDAGGDLLIVGAPGDGFAAPDVGVVYVFREQGSAWIQEAAFENPDLEDNSFFATELAFDGRTLVVGAPLADGSAGSGAENTGALYVYSWDGTTWTLDQRLPDAEFATDALVGNVDVHGNRIVAGGPGSLSDPGAVHLFERTPTGWVHTHEFTGALYDYGTGTAVFGEAILIGAVPVISAGPPADVGALELYRDLGSSAIQFECTQPSGTGADSMLGRAVALDGRQAGAGAPGFVDGFGKLAGRAWALELPDVLGPLVYCSTVRDTVGCLPYIDYTGIPSFSAAPGTLTLTAGNTINNKTGLLMYGFGRAAIPFLGGTLCIQPPVRRTQVQFTGGTAGPPDCTGQMTLDFTTQMQTSTDPFLVPGATVRCQYRYRDPGSPFGIAFTNALEFTIEP